MERLGSWRTSVAFFKIPDCFAHAIDLFAPLSANFINVSLGNLYEILQGSFWVSVSRIESGLQLVARPTRRYFVFYPFITISR